MCVCKSVCDNFTDIACVPGYIWGVSSLVCVITFLSLSCRIAIKPGINSKDSKGEVFCSFNLGFVKHMTQNIDGWFGL